MAFAIYTRNLHSQVQTGDEMKRLALQGEGICFAKMN